MSSQDDNYEPQDAVGQTLPATVIAGTAGLLASAVKNTLTKENVGPMGIFTRTGGQIALFAGTAAAYQFTRTAAANLREKNDYINEAIGGAFGGAIVGMRARTVPSVLGYALTLSVALGLFNYSGGVITGIRRDAALDDYDRKQDLKARVRRPIQETINEIGEGRGIYGPGYEERRKERIKEAYGIEPQTPWFKQAA